MEEKEKKCMCPHCERLRKVVRAYSLVARNQMEIFRVAAREKRDLTVTHREADRIWLTVAYTADLMRAHVSGWGARDILPMTDQEFEERLGNLPYAKEQPAHPEMGEKNGPNLKVIQGGRKGAH